MTTQQSPALPTSKSVQTDPLAIVLDGSILVTHYMSHQILVQFIGEVVKSCGNIYSGSDSTTTVVNYWSFKINSLLCLIDLFCEMYEIHMIIFSKRKQYWYIHLWPTGALLTQSSLPAAETKEWSGSSVGVVAYVNTKNSCMIITISLLYV